MVGTGSLIVTSSSEVLIGRLGLRVAVVGGWLGIRVAPVGVG